MGCLRYAAEGLKRAACINSTVIDLTGRFHHIFALAALFPVLLIAGCTGQQTDNSQALDSCCSECINATGGGAAKCSSLPISGGCKALLGQINFTKESCCCQECAQAEGSLSAKCHELQIPDGCREMMQVSNITKQYCISGASGAGGAPGSYKCRPGEYYYYADEKGLTGCCNGQAYNTASQDCCGGVVFDKRNTNLECCASLLLLSPLSPGEEEPDFLVSSGSGCYPPRDESEQQMADAFGWSCTGAPWKQALPRISNAEFEKLKKTYLAVPDEGNPGMEAVVEGPRASNYFPTLHYGKGDGIIYDTTKYNNMPVYQYFVKEDNQQLLAISRCFLCPIEKTAACVNTGAHDGGANYNAATLRQELEQGACQGRDEYCGIATDYFGGFIEKPCPEGAEVEHTCNGKCGFSLEDVWLHPPQEKPDKYVCCAEGVGSCVKTRYVDGSPESYLGGSYEGWAGPKSFEVKGMGGTVTCRSILGREC